MNGRLPPHCRRWIFPLLGIPHKPVQEEQPGSFPSCFLRALMLCFSGSSRSSAAALNTDTGCQQLRASHLGSF